MQKPARTGGVDDEPGSDIHRAPAADAAECYPVVRFCKAGQAGFVEVVDPQFLRFPNKELIEVGAVPVRVGDFVVWAGGDKKLARAVI